MLQSRLIAKRPTFSSVDEKIANMILTMPFDADLTSTSLASLCDVSQSTIVRFAQKLGYTSFREFLGEYVTFKHQQPSSITLSASSSSVQRSKEVLDYIDAHASSASFVSGINTLMSASKLFIVVDEQSTLIGSLWYETFQKYGYDCTLITPLSSLLSLCEMSENSVVLFIESSESMWLLEAVLLSKHTSSKSVLMTQRLNSGLSGYVNHVINHMPTNSANANFEMMMGCTHVLTYIVDKIQSQYPEKITSSEASMKRIAAIKALAKHKHHDS